MSIERTPYYEDMYRLGIEFQDFVVRQLIKKIGLAVSVYSFTDNQFKKGESVQGIEIKYDRQFQKTGNLYIETAEKTKPENTKYVSSGICRSDNSWLYVIGDYTRLYLFSTKFLRMLCLPQQDKKRYRFVSMPTTQGYLMPVSEAEKWCMLRIEIGEKDDPSPFLTPTKERPA